MKIRYYILIATMLVGAVALFFLACVSPLILSFALLAAAVAMLVLAIEFYDYIKDVR